MNEFLKLNWDTTSDSSYLEKQACSFISEEVLLDSYVYQHLKKRLVKPKKISCQNKEVNFFPGKNYVSKLPRKSSLTKQQQEHCLNAMKLLSQNRNPNQLKQTETYCLEVFDNLSAKITAENQEFITFAKNDWETSQVRIARLQNNLYRYAWMCFRKKYERYLHYGNFYKQQGLISMTYNEDDNVTVEVNCVQNLLELGTLARFSQPSLKSECRLSAQTLPAVPSSIQSNSKRSVSEDEHIKKLLENNDFDVAISSSGLKTLLDNTDTKATWTIPVKIENIEIDREGKKFKKKVVFIDKPLLGNHPDPLDLKYFSMKKLVKTNFCQYEAFSFEKQDSYPDEKLANLNKKLIELEKRMNKTPEEIIDEERKPDPGTSKEGDKEQEDELFWKKKNNKPDIIHHNASYRLWKFKKVDTNSTLMKNSSKNTEIHLLVRSKLDGCETTASGALQPVIVKPKIELQLEYGANIPTKSELSREWTSLFFRPFSNLYRVRMHWKTAEVVSIEKCTLQKVMSEANTLYQYNPYLGLGMLNELLNSLVELENGNYLLVHLSKHENFVSLWKECGSSLGNLSLKSEHKKCEINTDMKRSWNPIDLNYILPIHDFLKRPPGCFMPAVRIFKKGTAGFTKKKGKAKKNKKKTIPKKKTETAEKEMSNE